MAQPQKATKPKEAEKVPTPVNILWQGILMVSVTGTLDSQRTQELMESMLRSIRENEAGIIIMDILGVATVDSAVANHLVRITKATKLMGCECIITGMSPSIAQALVYLGIGLENIVTKATLRDGVALALNSLSLEVREVKEAAKKKAA